MIAQPGHRLSTDEVRRYRERTFRLQPALRLTSQADAVRFVNERGYVYFWPIKDITFPSLWCAVAGDRPVASEHDDPGHVTWRWKDESLGKRRWYYAKILRGRATMISLEIAPYFYALSENYGDPEQDYLELYRNGLMTQAGKAIYETLLAEGPLDTVNLRRLLRMTSKSSNSAFERGLTELQRDFKILPIGVANTGAWRYSFIYDLVHRHYPDLPERAHAISRPSARERLLTLYFEALGAATVAQVQRLFQWTSREVTATLEALTAAGTLLPGFYLDGHRDEHFVVPAMLG